MTSTTTKPDAVQAEAETAVYLFDDWFDPIEAGLRDRVRDFIETMFRTELDVALGRPRYARQPAASDGAAAGVAGHRHGSRTRTLTGTFGSSEITVPRARLKAGDGTTSEWKSRSLRAYQRRTKAADALIASTYLAGTNTRRVRRALAALFGGAVGNDTVSRVWRKVQTDWEAWNKRSLADEPIVRLILDGTVADVRLDRKATSISLLVVIGVRDDGQKILLAVRNMGPGERGPFGALNSVHAVPQLRASATQRLLVPLSHTIGAGTVGQDSAEASPQAPQSCDGSPGWCGCWPMGSEQLRACSRPPERSNSRPAPRTATAVPKIESLGGLRWLRPSFRSQKFRPLQFLALSAAPQ